MNNNFFDPSYKPTTAFGSQGEQEEETLDYGQVNVVDPTAAPEPIVDKSQFIDPMDANGLQVPAQSSEGQDMRTEAEKAAGEMEAKRDEYLARYRQAQEDASGSLYSKSGYQYQAETDDTSKWKETLLTGAAALFMVGMPAAGIAAAAMTWMGASDRQHRHKQIGYLEEKGYKPEDIDAWVTSGDHRLLTEDKASSRYLTPGAGKVFDAQTGQWVEGPSADGSTGGAGQRFMTIDGKQYNEGTIHNIPGRGFVEVKFSADGKGTLVPSSKKKYDEQQGISTGDSGVGVGTGGGDTTDIFQDDNGQYWQRQYDTKGNSKPPKHLPNYGKTLDAKQPDLYRVDGEFGVSWKNSDDRVVDLDDAPDNAMTTDGQRKSASFVRRATNAEKTFRDVTDPSKYNPTEWNAYISGKSMFPEIAKSDDRRKMEAARREFGNAVLRTDTGAAYSLLEQSDVDKLFPQAGDSAELVEQKRVQREEILAALAQGTGGAQRYAQSHIQKKLYGNSGKKAAPKESPSTADKRGAEFDKTSKKAQAQTSPSEEFPNYSGVREYKGWLIGRNKETGKVEKLRQVK